MSAASRLVRNDLAPLGSFVVVERAASEFDQFAETGARHAQPLPASFKVGEQHPVGINVKAGRFVHPHDFPIRHMAIPLARPEPSGPLNFWLVNQVGDEPPVAFATDILAQSQSGIPA